MVRPFQQVQGGSFLDRRYALAGQTVEALPTYGLSDGETILYKATAADTGAFEDAKWTLTYDASDGYWYVDGAPLVKEIDTSETTTSTSYADLATVGPVITVPFPGDYLFTFGALMSNSGVSSAVVSLDFGAGAADADNIVNQGTAGAFQSLARARAQSLAVAVAVTTKYKVGAGTGTFAKRFLNVLPLRVH